MSDQRRTDQSEESLEEELDQIYKPGWLERKGFWWLILLIIILISWPQVYKLVSASP